jgi:hypothetical protein
MDEEDETAFGPAIVMLTTPAQRNCYAVPKQTPLFDGSFAKFLRFYYNEPSVKIRRKERMFGVRRILPALLVFLGSCTPPVVTLVNPRNGDVRRCSVAETGAGAHAFGTETRIKACIHQWKSLGYVETEHLTPEERHRITAQP